MTKEQKTERAPQASCAKKARDALNTEQYHFKDAPLIRRSKPRKSKVDAPGVAKAHTPAAPYHTPVDTSAGSQGFPHRTFQKTGERSTKDTRFARWFRIVPIAVMALLLALSLAATQLSQLLHTEKQMSSHDVPAQAKDENGSGQLQDPLSSIQKAVERFLGRIAQGR